jgi:hypothetical protein
MATADDVRELALGLPETIEKSSYGTPGYRVKDRLFARIHQDGKSLVLRCDREQREAMHASQPRKFYWTPHYDNYDAVLVGLSEVDRDELASLLEMSWFFMAPPKVAAAYEAAEA